MEASQPEVQPLQVSVVIVTHNCVEPLRRCLAALARSKGREAIEVLVVDNGSRDGCESIDSEFPEVTVLRLPRHFGRTKARNIGFRTAKGEHLLLLSPFVEVAPDTVTALASRLEQESGALAVCPLLIGEDGAPASEAGSLPDAAAVSRSWSAGPPVAKVAGDASAVVPIELHDGRALLIRRQSIRGINYLDERFGEHWGDCDLAFQIRRAGKKILLLGDVRAAWRPEPEADEQDAARRTAFEADRAVGAASYVGKNFGFVPGLMLRLRIALGALFRFEFGLFQRVLNGQKIDGNDPAL